MNPSTVQDATARVDAAVKAHAEAVKVRDGAIAAAEETLKDAERMAANAQETKRQANEVYGKALEAHAPLLRALGLLTAPAPAASNGGSHAPPISQRLRFETSASDVGITISIVGKPETKRTIPWDTMRINPTSAAYAYTDAVLGPRSQVGNKGGTVANLFRDALRARGMR